MASSSRALAALMLSAAAAVTTVAAAPAAALEPAPNPTSAVGPWGGLGQSGAAPSVATVATPAATATPSPTSGSGVAADPAAGAVPGLATAWVLADLDTGEILATRNPDRPMRPASTQKLLTALTVAPRLDPEQPYRAIAADEKAEGNRVVLYRGLTYTASDLLHAALMPSANDAANALARANGGIRTTVEQMNAEAARLGARSTKAVNPSGLDAPGQVTTARDLALIGRAAFANPEIADYLKLTRVKFPGKELANGKRVIYPIYTHDRMLTDGFEGALGGKSGYTSGAGRTMVAAAERDGHRLLVTLLHIRGNTYRGAESLLNWGFANRDRLTPVGRLAEPSAPAPTFDRTIVPLPEKGAAPTARQALGSADAPTAVSTRSDRFLPRIPLPSLPSLPPLPSPLTLVMVGLAVVVLMRARVYWLLHRHRTGWVSLDAWAARQARSARLRAPSGPLGQPRRPDSEAAVQDEATKDQAPRQVDLTDDSGPAGLGDAAGGPAPAGAGVLS